MASCKPAKGVAVIFIICQCKYFFNYDSDFILHIFVILCVLNYFVRVIELFARAVPYVGKECGNSLLAGKF